MMKRQKEKTGPKGPRNKVKQVILIEGHPESIFYDKQVEVCSIKLHKGYLKLGSIGTDKVRELRELLSKRVVLETKTKRHSRKIPGVLSIKTTKNSTSLTIGAADQEILDRRVREVAELLGAPVQERCKWVCEIDKGKGREQVSEVQAYDIVGTPQPQATVEEGLTKPHGAQQPALIEARVVKPTEGMSKRTLQLREIALKAIKETEQEGRLFRRQR
jgi:hypothetical protein